MLLLHYSSYMLFNTEWDTNKRFTVKRAMEKGQRKFGPQKNGQRICVKVPYNSVFNKTMSSISFTSNQLHQ